MRYPFGQFGSADPDWAAVFTLSVHELLQGHPRLHTTYWIAKCFSIHSHHLFRLEHSAGCVASWNSGGCSQERYKQGTLHTQIKEVISCRSHLFWAGRQQNSARTQWFLSSWTKGPASCFFSSQLQIGSGKKKKKGNPLLFHVEDFRYSFSIQKFSFGIKFKNLFFDKISKKKKKKAPFVFPSP